MEIALLGQQFRINTDEDDRYLSILIEHYQALTETVKKTTNSSNEQIVAILAGLLAVDEYYKLQQQSNSNAGQALQAATANHEREIATTQNELKEALHITNSILSKINEVV